MTETTRRHSLRFESRGFGLCEVPEALLLDGIEVEPWEAWKENHPVRVCLTILSENLAK